MSEAATKPAKSAKHAPSPEEQAQARQQQGIKLAIAKLNADIANARDERHKQMLESAKAELEKKLNDR